MASGAGGQGSHDVLTAPLPVFSAEQAVELASEIFGVDGTATPLDGERDLNFRIRPVTSGDADPGYVLKIANQAEDPTVLDLQQEALAHVAAVDPSLPVPRIRATVDGARSRRVPGAGGASHSVWMLSFLPGRQLDAVLPTARLRREVGGAIASLARALRGFFHPAAGREILWDLKHASRLRRLLAYVPDPARRGIAEAALDRFDARAAAALPRLRAQVIHADANSANVIVDAADPERVAGIIDFGDIVHGALVGDLGVAFATVIGDCKDPIDAACDIVTGYHAVTPLLPEELDVLLELWLGRLVAEVVIAAWRSQSHAGNLEYINASVEPSWTSLERLLRLPPDAARRAFGAACGESGPARADAGAETNEQMIARRKRLLGPAYSLFYERPVRIVRGEGVWLFDETGRRYLDAYNNVAHVGHCHPHVVEAIATQSRTLNTNTRYLHEKILEYAERLGATMPGDLEVCMFVCTGSEANDLAWRLAKAHTGHTGGLAMCDAYHGTTDAVTQLSPSELRPGEKSAAHIEGVIPPNGYRGPHRRIRRP